MDKLLYRDEHIRCPNYDASGYPLIEEIIIEQNREYRIDPHVNKILFILEGKTDFACGPVKDMAVENGHMLFIPAGRNTICRAKTETRLLILRLNERIRLCDCFKIEDMHKIYKGISIKGQLCILRTNTVMAKYLELLTACHRQGLRCKHYNLGKVKEFMFILRGFYTKDQLACFFAPALSGDTEFSQFIMGNYRYYRNLGELAEAMNYTVSGFEKKFRRVFGSPPYRWIKQQKANEAYHLVTRGELNIKQISDMFGFSSPAAFGKFFRQNFGISPRKIHKENDLIIKGGNG